MNTPKLNSIILNPATGSGASQANRTSPLPGLDFSKLLGEKQEQAASSIAGPRDRSAERRADTPTQARDNATRNEPPRSDAASARSTERPDEAASRNERVVAEKPRTENGRPARDADSAKGSNSSNDSNGASGATGNDTAARTDSSNTTNGTEAGAQVAPTQPTQAATPGSDAINTGLAQHAAEAGLAALVAAQTPVTATAGVTAEVTAAATPGAPVPAVAVQATLTGLPTAKLAGQTDAAPLDTAAHPAAMLRPGFQGLTALPAANPDLPQALAQALNPATAPATNSQLPTAALASALDPEIITPAPAAASSAAALSLQEFSAMVEAARATSGTSLTPNTAALPATGPSAAAPFAALMPAGFNTTMAAAPGATAAGGIAAPLHSPQWSTEFSKQFISIAQAGKGLGQVAELRLDPPELGPLRITINLNDNVAHAVFSSPHAAVRQTVENALPQLQQMLEQAGISLGQANVNDQQQSGQEFDESRGGSAHASAGGNGVGSDTPADLNSARTRPADPSALVDTFA